MFQRYYHLFAKGELRLLVLEAAQELGLQDHLVIVRDVWERGNWLLEAKLEQPTS